MIYYTFLLEQLFADLVALILYRRYFKHAKMSLAIETEMMRAKMSLRGPPLRRSDGSDIQADLSWEICRFSPILFFEIPDVSSFPIWPPDFSLPRFFLPLLFFFHFFRR